MSWFSRRKAAYLLLGALLAVALGAAWMVSPQWSRTGNGMVSLQGNMPAVLDEASLVSHADSTKPMDVVLGLKLRNEPELNTLIANQSDPASPQFRKFISPDAFVARFAPDEKEVTRLVAHVKSTGLNVVAVAPNRLLIHVRGTVEEIEKAFDVRINTYQFGPREAFSNDRDPRIPTEFKDLVQSVIGLNSFSAWHKMHVPSVKRQAAATAAPAVPSGFGPRDLATAYNFPSPLNSKAGSNAYTGAGVTLAIASVYSYLDSDMQVFWKQYGIQRTGTITNIYVNGVNSTPDDETTLDLQQVSSLAPGADILMYLGSDPEFSTFAKIFNQIVSDNRASVVSISWGSCEQNTGKAEMSTEHAIFRQGAAQGITFVAAAGDDGAYDCNRKKQKRLIAVDYPSSDPYVTAVGGTALRLKPDGSRLSERAWIGAGGAYSQTYARPSWQFGPGVPNGKWRNSSDLSLNADPWTADATYFKGEWDSSGGTSFAAPDIAALFGLMVHATGSRIGYALPTLYRLGRSPDYAGTFFDVTVGANGNGKGPGFPAGPGWDHPTGWGSPDGTALTLWWVKDQKSSANPGGTPLTDAVPLTNDPRVFIDPQPIFTSPARPANRWRSVPVERYPLPPEQRW